MHMVQKNNHIINVGNVVYLHIVVSSKINLSVFKRFVLNWGLIDLTILRRHVFEIAAVTPITPLSIV